MALLPSHAFAHLARRISLAGVGLAYASFVLLGIPGHIAATDSTYHFGIAARIWGGDLAPDPSTSYPWTAWRDLPVDHYWGFHVLIAPFAAFASREVGMKLAAAVLFAAFLCVLGIVLERRRVVFPWAWAGASVLVGSQDWRYLQLRGGVLMAALLLVFLEVAFFVEDAKRRRRAIALLALLATLSYNGAFLLLPMHVAGLFGLALERERSALRARIFEPLLTGAGLVAGLVVNPYFDLRLSTFRFAFFNVWIIGRDAGRLFVGRENLESNPFPFDLLLTDGAWAVLLLLLAAAIGSVALRVARKAPVDRAELVYGALSLVGIALTARMLRLREYAVPVGFVFLAIVARRALAPALATPLRAKIAAALTLLALGGAAVRQVYKTRALIVQTHPSIDLYAGARPILESHAGAPVGNLVLGDGNLLLWEWPGVQVAQGGSPYFLFYRDPSLYADLHTLHDAPSDDAVESAVERMRGRGTRLLSVRAALPFHGFAARHPDRVRQVYAHPRYLTSLYEILPPR